MKQMITNNIGLKIVSLIVAFFCWLIIITISDPTISKTFSDIPVTILNENVIASADYIFEVVSGDRINVTVKGKRSVVESIKSSDFTAKADMSKLSKVYAVAIDVALVGIETGNVTLDWNNEVLKVSLEKKVTSNYKVIYKVEGAMSPSYVLGDVLLETPIIEVSGGESKMKRIASVGVVIMIDNQKQDFEKELTPILYDEDGSVITSENIVFDKDSIKVKVSILPTKTIPVIIEVSGKPKKDYRLVQKDFGPEEIRIAGPADLLKQINVIKIPINIQGKKKDVEKEIDTASYLDQQIIVAEEYGTISIRCVIEHEGKRTVSLMNGDITTINLSPDMTCTFLDGEKKYDLDVFGKEEVLKDITLASIAPYLDLNGYHEGMHTIALQYDLPVGITIKDKIKISVRLERTEKD